MIQISKSYSESQIDALNNQVNELLNIDESVMSVEDAISLLIAERKALDDLAYDSQLESLTVQYDELEHLKSIVTLLEKDLSVYDILKAGREDKDPNINLPPITQYPAYESNQEMVGEIKALRKDLDNANAQIGENTKKTADSVRRLEYITLERV